MEDKVRSYPDERWGVVQYHLETVGKDYHFSDYGRIKSVDKESGRERLLKGSRLRTGFLLVSITFKGGINKGFFVHKLIAEEWIEKTSEDQEFVIHINRDVRFNHYKNLQWMTKDEKTAVLKEQGTFDPKKRKRNPHYKLNASRVKLIRKRLKEGKNKKKIIAKEFGISINHLREIQERRMWGWVED